MDFKTIPTFSELQSERDALAAQLHKSNARVAEFEKTRTSEAQNLDAQKAKADESLAQRVAEILASKMQGPRVHGTTLNQPARVVGHMGLRCKACGITRAADHPGPAGGCGGNPMLSHDFHGIDTVVQSVDSLQPHHAIFVDGTVSYPAQA